MKPQELRARVSDLRYVRKSPYRPAVRNSGISGLIHDRTRSHDPAARKLLARMGASIHGASFAWHNVLKRAQRRHPSAAPVAPA